MREFTIEERAEELYEDCPTVKPLWGQLGEVTKEVWRERARDGVSPEGNPPLITQGER